MPCGSRLTESAITITPSVPYRPVGIVRKAQSNPKLSTSAGTEMGNIPSPSRRPRPRMFVLLAAKTMTRATPSMTLAETTEARRLFVRAGYAPELFESRNWKFFVVSLPKRSFGSQMGSRESSVTVNKGRPTAITRYAAMIAKARYLQRPTESTLPLEYPFPVTTSNLLDPRSERL